MKTKKQNTATHTWEMMQCARESLGQTCLQKIFSRGQTQINRYCSTPIHEDHQRNPFDRLHLLFTELEQAGERELVIAALNHLAGPVGCRTQETAEFVPDKMTVAEECLDDYPEKVELDRLITINASPAIVRRQGEQTCREIMETVISYEQHCTEQDY